MIKSSYKTVQYKMDINRGYDELWKCIFSLFNMVLARNEVKNKMIIKQLIFDLMKFENFDSIKHNNKLSDVYEIVEHIFSNIDYDAEFKTIKYGQVERQKTNITKLESKDFLINNNYLFY
jgi:hypothetical protein